MNLDTAPPPAQHGMVSPRQLARLNDLLAEILPRNSFQAGRLGGRRKVESVAALAELPFLTKKDLVSDSAASPPFGTNLTYPLERYTRFFQTSGTTGAPLPVLDTPESWSWWGRCWRAVFHTARVSSTDRVFFAFSFGPFIGFWAAHEGATALGALCIPGGGASSSQRLRMILDTRATVLLATPSYALHLAEVAAKDGVEIRGSAVRVVVVAGEAGGSIPATRARIMEAWGADLVDHAGASEVGAWGIGCSRGLCVNEEEFIAEVIDSETGAAVLPGSGAAGELVLTNLGRAGWPVIRYRTGDLVRPLRAEGPQGPQSLILEGGILGRADDMVTVRGVNVFPSALEDVIRSVAGGAEFRITATRRGTMDEVAVEVEGDEVLMERVAGALRVRIGLRMEVAPVAPGSLPRWEGKARRFVKVHS